MTTNSKTLPISSYLPQISKLRNGEFLSVLTALMVMLIAIYLLVTDFSFFNVDDQTKTKQIGEVVSSKNVVKHRSASTPLWTGIQNQQPLFVKDHIFTDASSQTDIMLIDSLSLTIEESSLVILDDVFLKSVGIDLKRGRIRINSNRTQIPVVVKAGNQRISLKVGETVTVDESGRARVSRTVQAAQAAPALPPSIPMIKPKPQPIPVARPVAKPQVMPVVRATAAPVPRVVAKPVPVPMAAPIERPMVQAKTKPVPVVKPEPRPESTHLPLTDPSPGDKTIVNFDNLESRDLDISWKSPKDISELKVIISQKNDFSDADDYDVDEGKTTVNVSIDDDGAYYWKVEGVHKKKKLAMVSPTQQFTVTTTEVTRNRNPQDHFVALLGTLPNTLKLTQHTDSGPVLKTNLKFSKSYVGMAYIPFGRSFGLAGYAHTQTTKGQLPVDYTVENEESKTKIEDAQQSTYYYSDGKVLFRYRYLAFTQKYPVYLGVHGGYGYGQVVNFYPDTVGYSINQSDIHNGVLGVNVNFPLWWHLTMDANADYLKPMKSTPVSIKNGSNITYDAKLLLDFLNFGVLGAGVLYQAQQYQFVDSVNAVSGKIEMDSVGYMALLGLMI